MKGSLKNCSRFNESKGTEQVNAMNDAKLAPGTL